MGSLANKGQTPLVPHTLPTPEYQRTFHNWAKRANQGGLVPTGLVTLNAGVSTTTVTDARIGAASQIDFMPTTPNAAASWKQLLVTGQTGGMFIITHSSLPTTDRTFRYCIMG